MRGRKSSIHKLFFAGILMIVAMPGVSPAYLADSNVYLPIDYWLFLPPAAGETYLDPAFGTRIKRLSDAMNMSNSAGEGSLQSVTNEYSTMSPFNAGGSRMLVQHRSYLALHDGEGNYLKDISFEVTTASEPRWSRLDPDVFYYLLDNVVKRYNVVTDEKSIVRIFSDYERISGLGESDLSADGDHMVLVGDNRYIFVYTLSTNTISPVLDTAGTNGFDHVYITPDNNVLVGWYESGEQAYNGIELYDSNMTFLRQVAQTLGHMDVTRDMDGSGILLWANAGDPEQPADCENGVVKIRLDNGERTCLISFAWGVAMHIAAADKGEWFVVSTFTPADPLPLAVPAGEWPAYANEVLQINLDGSEVRRLAHHRSRPFNEYAYMPRAALSQDGGKLVYSSNYGLQEILAYPEQYSDVYLIDLDSTAPATGAGSQRVPVTRAEQDAGVVSYTGEWHTHFMSRHSAESAMLATGAGDSINLEFDGTDVTWIGFRDAWSGIARVYVDGQYLDEVDTHLAAETPQAALYSVRDLSPGTHTLTIEATGYSSPESDGAWIWVDAFDITARVDHNAPAVSYTGEWYTLTHESLSGGSVRVAMGEGYRAEFVFEGTAVSWIGYTDRWSGIARVYMDGKHRTDIDTYAPFDRIQARVYTLSDLEPGTHTLAIEVTGRRNPDAEGSWVWVDAFDILP